MSKIIPMTSIGDINNRTTVICTAYYMRESLIRGINLYNKSEESLKKDGHFRFKKGEELVALMADKNVSDRLDLDEIIAIAECRIKKADATIQDCTTYLFEKYAIQFKGQAINGRYR